ncbi:MAG TPA: hypothetical protein GX715_17635 [Armatimonadetes bacterium]|jgi:hypothetical protein|nr:hypothetical protein [Armatimonadota bacterium]
MWRGIRWGAIGLAAVTAGSFTYGRGRWASGTRKVRARLEAAREPIESAVFHAPELDGLPEPVQRYFQAALKDGQPIVSAASMEQTGHFNLGERGENWKPFTASQRVITRRPGFDWDARVALAPGLAVHVRDAYVAGEGLLYAAPLGLFTVMDVSGQPGVAEGELMRFFAEAAWYPTALLPSQGVRWEAMDDRTARATLADGELDLTMTFGFNDEGLIETARAEARGRMVGDTVVPTPWEGRFGEYATRDGMRVPLYGEVAWILPEGPRPYWRGHITRVAYELAQ